MQVSLEDGARTLARGLRTSNPAIAGLGALILALAVLRTQEPVRTSVYRATVRPGESIRVAVVRAEPTRKHSA